MFAKLFLAAIVACAFCYALYLILLRKSLRLPERHTGLAESRFWAHAKWLFILATLTIVSCAEKRDDRAVEPEVNTPVQAVETLEDAEAMTPGVLQALRLAWRTLNTKEILPGQARESGMNEAVAAFRQALDEAVRQQALPQDAARNLAAVHQAMAYDLWRAHNGASCYEGGRMVMDMHSAAALRQQLKLLREAKENGTLTDEAVANSVAAIRGRVEVIKRISEVSRAKNGVYTPGQRTLTWEREQELKQNPLDIMVSTEEAVTLILQLEEIGRPG